MCTYLLVEIVVQPHRKKEVFAVVKKLLKQHKLGYVYVRAGMPHCTTFFRRVNDDLTLYVVTHWHSYEDKFGFGVGWTYRKTLDSVCSLFNPETALKDDAAIIGLSSIGGELAETMWDVRTYRVGSDFKAVAQDIPAIVSDAFSRLVQVGLPYLDRVIETKLSANPTR